MQTFELLNALTGLVCRGTEVSLSSFQSTCEIDAGPVASTPGDVLSHLKARAATLLQAVCAQDSATIVFDSVAATSGVRLRESWSFLLSDGLIQKVIACCGPVVRDLEPSKVRELDHYLRGFGFRFAQEAERNIVRTAQHAVSKAVGRSAEFSFAATLVNDDLIYVPPSSIGCNGYLFVRESGTVVALGSTLAVPIHIWAYYRGFAAGETAKDRPNDLVITSVRDRVATLRMLRRHFRSPPSLEVLPLRIRSVDLYSFRQALWEAELRGLFQFQIAPASSSD